MNDGRLPFKEFERFRDMDFIRENPKEMKKLKTQAEVLVQEVEFLTKKIEESNIEQEIKAK